MLTYAVGDIHGRADLLDAMLAKVDAHAASRPRRLVFLGDYVDRGPASAAVLHRVRMLQRRDTIHVVCLKGNHEDMMLRAAGGEEWDALWRRNGGEVVEDQEVEAVEPIDGGFECEFTAGDLEFLDEVGGPGEEDFPAVLDEREADGRCEVALAAARGAEEEQVRPCGEPGVAGRDRHDLNGGRPGSQVSSTLIPGASAGLRASGLVAPFVLDGPINREAFEIYVARILVPDLRPGDVVAMDNHSSHQGPRVREMAWPTSVRYGSARPSGPGIPAAVDPITPSWNPSARIQVEPSNGPSSASNTVPSVKVV